MATIELGIRAADYYEMTFYELNCCSKHQQLKAIDRENELIRSAYYIASLVWAEKRPELESLMLPRTLTEKPKPKPKKVYTDNELLDIAKSKGLKVPKV